MKTHLKLLVLSASVLALAACEDSQSWGTEAGSFIDEGGFGNPTMNNTLVQSGDLVVNLNNRFAQEVPSTVNFAFDSAVLDDQARATLRRQADWIRQFPEVRFRVFGHTDLVGSEAYNRQLGQRRANAVVAFLSSEGISRSRLEAVTSFGETRPLIVTSDRERRNRRTVTEVTGFVGGSQEPIDGKYAQVIYREYVQSATELPPTEGGGLEAIGATGGD